MEMIDTNMSNKGKLDFRPWGIDKNQFCMLMHLSQLAGYIIPIAGIALPIVMWVSNKDQSDLIDRHGKNIINWMLSCYIYLFAGFILSVILIGIPIVFAVGICSLIFTIIGAFKANDGIVYQYPFSIKIIK